LDSGLILEKLMSLKAKGLEFRFLEIYFPMWKLVDGHPLTATPLALISSFFHASPSPLAERLRTPASPAPSPSKHQVPLQSRCQRLIPDHDQRTIKRMNEEANVRVRWITLAPWEDDLDHSSLSIEEKDNEEKKILYREKFSRET
jgi:hypothetical protein